MISVAIKMLIGDKLKYFGLVAGVAFAALLIIQQGSILVGLTHQTGSFIRDMQQADLWIMDPQVRFSQDVIPLSDSVLPRVRGIAGVDWAVPMYQGFLKTRLPDGTRQTMILVGLDDATLIGGPPEMVRGTLTDLRDDKAIIIDSESLASKFKFKQAGTGHMDVGMTMDINDHEVKVVGTYKASKSFFWEPTAYTTYSRALSLAPPERKMMTYVLVKAQPGEPVADLKARIESTTGLKARTNDDFIGITGDYILKETGILVNFGLAVGLGFLVGALVAGQMLYNFTLDNLRYYGTLKAMGASNLRLVGMVLAQAALIGFLGYGIGLGAGTVLGKVVGDAGLAFMMPWYIPVLGGVAIIGCCLLAAAISLIRVLRLEPAMVFRS